MSSTSSETPEPLAEPTSPLPPETPESASAQETLSSTEPSNRLKKRHLLVYFFASALALFLLACALVGGAAYCLLAPLGDKVAPQTIVITKGTSVQGIATQLDENKLVLHPLVFRAVAKIIADDKLHAGEYQFLPTQNLVDIVTMLRDGLSVIRRFTVPEGLTSAEIVTLLKNDPALSGEITSIPPEGSLWPETYHYSFGDARLDLLTRMRAAAREQTDALWRARAADLPLSTLQEALTMASIVEKETGKKADERARVAGVFYNRLKKGMRLQSDPTVIYALTKGEKPLDRDLSRADLEMPSPYNTYTQNGLPPGPICNPGKASILAALHPEKNDFYYFVADGTGGHAFAKDLPDHNKNVTKWHQLSHP